MNTIATLAEKHEALKAAQKFFEASAQIDEQAMESAEDYKTHIAKANDAAERWNKASEIAGQAQDIRNEITAIAGKRLTFKQIAELAL